MELLRLTPEPHMREGYVMVFLNVADDYVRAILHDFPERGFWASKPIEGCYVVGS